MYGINEYYKRLSKLAAKTGYNAYLVIRDGEYVETTVLKVGDVYLQRAKGTKGDYPNGHFINVNGIVHDVSQCPYN